MKRSSLEIIGFILGVSPVVFPPLLGTQIYRSLRDFAELEIGVMLPFRPHAQLLSLLMVAVLLGEVMVLRKVDKEWVGHMGSVLTGIFEAQVLIYLILNYLFFLNAFVLLPSLLGLGLLSGIIMSYHSMRRATGRWRRRALIGKLVTLGVLALLLFTPAVIQMLVSPRMQALPDEGGQFPVRRLQVVQEVNETYREITVDPSRKWYSYVYVPEGVKGSVPVFIFLHGFSGDDPRYYDHLLRAVSSRGVLGIFVQYPSEYDEGRLEEFARNYGLEEDVLSNVPRYLQEWDGIKEALSLLNDSTGGVGQEFWSKVPGGYDLSRLMIAGHSLGGGMSLFITSRALAEGWGSSRFVLDIEAGWVSSLQSDMTLLPDNTLVNVVTYEDDVIVPACLSAKHFERIRSRDGAGQLPDSQVSYIIVRSDFHGYPRALANHYSPTDLIQDNIYHRAVLQRLSSMGSYLVDGTHVSDFMEDTDMGRWDDGHAFLPLIRTTDPLGIRGSEGVQGQVRVFEGSGC